MNKIAKPTPPMLDKKGSLNEVAALPPLMQELNKLQLLMRQEMTEVEQLFWLQNLDSFPIDDVREAIGRWVKSPNDFLPKIGQVLAILDEIERERIPDEIQPPPKPPRDEMKEWADKRRADQEADPEGFAKAEREFLEKIREIGRRKSMPSAADIVDETK